MARRRSTRRVTVPPTFVGTFYDTEAGVYYATRKDGSVTVGKLRERGVNIIGGLVLPESAGTPVVRR